MGALGGPTVYISDETLGAPRAREPGLAAGFTSRLNLAVDLAVLSAAVVLPFWWHGPLLPAELRPLVWVTAALASTWIVTAASLRHYASFAYQREMMDETAMITIMVFAVVTMLALLHLLAPVGTPLPRIPYLLIVLWSLTLLLRIGVFRRVASREPPVDDVLVVGVNPIARLTAQDLRRRGRNRVVGHLRFSGETDKDLDLLRRTYAAEGLTPRIIGDASEIEEIVRRVPVEEIYLAGTARKNDDEMQHIIRVCEQFGIPFALPAYSFRLERAQPTDRKAVSDGYLHYHHTESKPQQMALKRLFDLVAAGLALWLLLPLLLAVIALIKLTSRGPIFFRQARVGLNGHTFNMLKFRSMVVNAEALKSQLARSNEQSGPVFKMRNDPRVTAIGRFIRKYSIDELPQLVNVLRGDMSVVGPRPPVPEEVAKYEAWQRRRLAVRPGLTCIWQVSGRNQISFEEWMYLDMQYIDHWSLAQDLNLIFRTVPVVITGRGAS